MVWVQNVKSKGAYLQSPCQGACIDAIVFNDFVLCCFWTFLGANVDAIVPAGGAAIYDYRVSCMSVIE